MYSLPSAHVCPCLLMSTLPLPPRLWHADVNDDGGMSLPDRYRFVCVFVCVAAVCVCVDYDNGTSIQPVDLTTASSSADSGTREAANTPTGTDEGQPIESSQPDSIMTDGTVGSDGSVTPSSPRDVEALIVSSRFVTLRWKEPVRTNGPIIGYSVFYRQEGSERY